MNGVPTFLSFFLHSFYCDTPGPLGATSTLPRPLVPCLRCRCRRHRRRFCSCRSSITSLKLVASCISLIGSVTWIFNNYHPLLVADGVREGYAGRDRHEGWGSKLNEVTNAVFVFLCSSFRQRSGSSGGTAVKVTCSDAPRGRLVRLPAAGHRQHHQHTSRPQCLSRTKTCAHSHPHVLKTPGNVLSTHHKSPASCASHLDACG